ncbi:MAG: helix-turn-helix domain-containing protein [Oscillospiraceae bacterium]|nr:helix-turn-helix domain-containing protein [Oscillospiraceae bacterium]
MMMNKMNSINQTAKLCKEHNIGISRRFLIELAKNGDVPSIRVGQKILINWDELMRFLNTNTLSPDKPKSGIRKISA